ncbi:amino acid transporter [Pseudovirgaria hyperparasitica]|uniref:Amino acid transporter n=1 Tax=Pseudovirgaria hyperparasitica TaxID=470096 RepID=A0A6A6VU01_9PEZI|nr:amino acid transporter [Pseudovirgaria hyperparasitica]KAF2752721.1 amino acid transporter [Pseudovirgaria hyperparasitica]
MPRIQYLPRDSLELASLASSEHSARSSIESSASGIASSRKLSFDEEDPLSERNPAAARNRSYSVNSTFDFSANLFPLSSTAVGYTALGAPSSTSLDPTHNLNGGSLEKNKTLTYLNGLSLVIGIIVGSGIFSSPAQVNKNAGSPGASLIVWVIAGLLTWTGAASYAELGGAIPLNGGAQVYLSKIFGELAGFEFTWCAICVLKPGSAAIVAIIFGEYIVRAVIGPDAMATSIWISKGIALGALVLVTALNCVSTKLGTRSADVFMFFKFVALLGVTVIGIVVAATGFTWKGEPSDEWKTHGWFEGTNKDVSNWAVAIYAGLWAFDGWDNVNYVTGEMVNPHRDLPRVIHTSIPIVIVSYILANVAYFFVLPMDVIESSNTVAVTFGAKVFGPVGAFFLALIVAGSCFGALNANCFTSGRLAYAAGQEGFLPSIFGKIGVGSRTVVRLGSSRTLRSKGIVARLMADEAGLFFTPVNAMLLNTVLAAVYVVVGEFEALTTFYGVAGYIFYFFTVLGLIVLRVREPKLERPYKTWITTPIIFCCVSLFLLSRAVFAEPFKTLIVVGFMVAGVPVYFFRVARKSRREGDGQEKGWWRFWHGWR